MSRLRIGVVLVVILCLGLQGGLAVASSPSGVSVVTQDWAYKAIEDLGSGRQIAGLAVPTEMNRNQGALLVARLLQHLSGDDHLESRRFGVSKNVYLDSMIFTYNQRVTPEQQFTATQVELLYRLVLEFRPELEILGYAIQDFNFLYDQAWQQATDGLFAKRPLLYSEQAVSAARKLEEERRASSQLFSFAPQTAHEEEAIAELSIPTLEPRSLWTGHVSSQVRNLPPSSSLLVQAPEPEPNTSIHIGGIEVSGGIRPVPSGTQPSEKAPPTEGGAAYGISVKLGDLALKTAVDHLVTDSSQVTKITGTSVDLNLDWSDLFTLSAGYRQLEVPRNLSGWEDVPPLVTSLGVEVPITRGTVHLGVTQEWPKFTVEEGNGDLDDELGKAKNIAELGLSYEFENDSSLRFNYKFIDFSNVEQGHGASAEFSIKF
jgi:hypothetical protein